MYEFNHPIPSGKHGKSICDINRITSLPDVQLQINLMSCTHLLPMLDRGNRHVIKGQAINIIKQSTHFQVCSVKSAVQPHKNHYEHIRISRPGVQG